MFAILTRLVSTSTCCVPASAPARSPPSACARLPMPQARMLRPLRSAISLRCAIAFGSSSISIASLVPLGFDGDHTLALAAVKKLSASFASSRSRMCGMVTPSAPASRISFTRAFVASAPSLLDRRDADDQRLAARLLEALAVRLHRGGIVGAFEIEEDVVVERIRRHLRGAFRRVHRRLAALALRSARRRRRRPCRWATDRAPARWRRAATIDRRQERRG